MAEYCPDTHARYFPFLAREEAETFFAAMEPLDLGEGEILFRSGQPADYFYVLVAGKIAVQKHTGFAERMQVVALLDPGAPLGESGLLTGRQRGATLTAVQPCRLLSLSAQAFESLAQSQSPLAVKLLTWVVERISLRLQKSSERLALVL
jgi:CRP/FNR family transcriptional regulator, cyclic AMP receptor protein